MQLVFRLYNHLPAVSPTLITGFFDVFGTTVLQNPDITHASEPGAFQKCAARIQRLDCLNAGIYRESERERACKIVLLDESTRAKRFSFSCVCNFLITTFNATALSRIENPDFQCIVTDNVIASFPFLNICLPDTAMETCSDTSWSQSENTGMLIHRLKSNPYFSALQSSIAKSRKRWLEVNRNLLVTISIPSKSYF